MLPLSCFIRNYLLHAQSFTTQNILKTGNRKAHNLNNSILQYQGLNIMLPNDS